MDKIFHSALEVTNTVLMSNDSNVNLLFKNVGFKNVAICRSDLDRALSLITSETCDLLVLDDIFDNEPTTQIIRDVRQGKIGDNIFLPIISLISTTDAKDIKEGIEAGADDVVIKPLSVNIINTRIGGFLKRKMQYIVTPDYIGPARRPEEQVGFSKDQLIDVPNIMRAKSEGRDDVVAQLQEEIQSASENVNDRRISMQGHQINDLITRLVAKPDNFDSLIKRVRDVALEFTERLKNTDLSHVSELCEMLRKVTGELKGLDDKHNVELLVLLGQAISLSFKEDKTSRLQAQEMIKLIKSKF